MKLWLLCFLSVVLAASASPQRCPEKCKCNTNSYAECTSLDTTHFGLEIFRLKIVKNPNLKLSFEVLKKLGLESLIYLEIEDSIITQFHKDAFAGIPLNEIVIKNSVLPEIPRLLFEPLPELKSVNFFNNTLTNFQGISSSAIEQLVIQQCGLRKIEQSCRNCTQLSYLDVSFNQIESMSTFYSLGVDTLNVSHNKIKSVDFQIDNNLATVDLSYNPIETIKGYSEVEKLILKSCGLKDLDFIEDFSLLSYFDVSDNKLKKLESDVFQKLPQLQTLDLSNNKLTMLDNDVFLVNDFLSKLILDGNFLRTLPQFISDGKTLRLEHFSCSNCGIEVLEEDTFRHTPSIVLLDLKNNHLKQIPAKLFQYIPNLASLDLTNNSINVLERDTFKKNSNLKFLVLAGNPLQSVDPVIFSNNRVLKELDVSNCNLTKLWNSTQSKIPSLSVLRVKNNFIKKITENELEVVKNLNTLIVKGNKFDCNNIETILNYLTNLDVYERNDDESVAWNDCNEDYDSFNNYDEYSDTTSDSTKAYSLNTKDDDYDADYQKIPEIIDEPDNVDQQFFQDAQDVQDVESIDSRLSKEQPRREIVVFLLPTLVFVLTALIVLVFTVSAILCILYKRNKKPNAPQINIIPWSSTPKIKKHSGSVYRPLSEEKVPV